MRLQTIVEEYLWAIQYTVKQRTYLFYRQICQIYVERFDRALTADALNAFVSDMRTQHSYSTAKTVIGNSAFSGCTGLTSISVPNTVTTIDYYAFYGCTGLTNIVIPNSVTSIKMSAFYGCTSLVSLTVPFINTNTELFDWFDSGSIFRPHRKIPATLKSLIITGGTSIADELFSGCTWLTSISIPSSVTSIGENAFYGCTSLTSVTIPDSVTSIGGYAFDMHLSSVFFTGSVDEWLSITDRDDPALSKVTLYCYSATQPTTAGHYWYYDESGNIAIWS